MHIKRRMYTYQPGSHVELEQYPQYTCTCTCTCMQCIHIHPHCIYTYRPGSHVELERVPPEQMPPAELAARRSRLVFIGRTAGLEATLRQGFEAL